MSSKKTFTLLFQKAGILVLSLILGSCSMLNSSKKDDPIPSQAKKDQKEKPAIREVTIPLEKAISTQNTLPQELTEIQASLEPKKQDPKGVRFTMSARGVNIKNVLFALSQEIEQNIIIEPGVNEQASVDLKNVTLEQALEALLPPLRLEYEITPEFIRIRREEMQTRTFFLNYVISKRTGNSNLTSSSGTSGTTTSGGSSSSGNSEANTRSTSAVESSEETDLWSEILSGLKFIVTPSASSASDGDSEGSSEDSSSSESSDSAGGDSSGLVASLLGGAAPSSGVEGSSEDTSEDSSTSTTSDAEQFVESGYLVVNKQAGMIVVKDYPSVLLQVAEYLEAIEGSVQRQVFIQAKIVEVTLNDDYKLGINWGNVSPFTLTHAGGASLAQTVLAGAADFSYGLSNANFSIVVDALSKQGQVSVLSSPKIATLNNQRAVIKVGTEDIFFVPEVTAATTTSAATTEFIPTAITIGIVLDVVPQINPNGQIMMSINTSITEQSGSRTSPDGVNVVPVLDVRESNNVVLAQHGQTIVIGGLMKTKKEVDDNSVPFFGALPYVGKLFHWDQETEAKTELVIMLTPEIMAGRAVDEKFLNESSTLRNFGYDRNTDRTVNPSFKR